MNTSPALSVLMPAYNPGIHLVEAVRSILEQTYSDFELIVVDDGSTDDIVALLKEFEADDRLQIVHNERNLGLITTLNKGLALCRASLIARMDADDICDRQRFERQVAFLAANQNIDIVGGAIEFFGNIPKPTVFQFPTVHEAIRPAMLFFCPLAHPALMFRRELVDRGLLRYDDGFRHAEDYHLWSRLLLKVRSANLPEVVLNYRLHKSQVSSGQANHQYSASLRVRGEMYKDAGISPTDQEIDLHESVVLEKPLPGSNYLEALATWFWKIESANQKSLYWDTTALHELLVNKFNETLVRVGGSADYFVYGENFKHYGNCVLIKNNINFSLRTRLLALLRQIKTVLR